MEKFILKTKLIVKVLICRFKVLIAQMNYVRSVLMAKMIVAVDYTKLSARYRKYGVEMPQEIKAEFRQIWSTKLWVSRADISGIRAN